MWTLTPDNLAQAKNELRGRRAAIEVRHAAELKAIDSDIEEIETLERVAQSFSVKHPPVSDAVVPEASRGISDITVAGSDKGMAVSEPEAVSIEPAAAEMAEPGSTALREEAPPPSSDGIAQLQSSPEEPPVSPDAAPKGGSLRWRIRIPSNKEVA
jgi:hypothetical protein